MLTELKGDLEDALFFLLVGDGVFEALCFHLEEVEIEVGKLLKDVLSAGAKQEARLLFLLHELVKGFVLLNERKVFFYDISCHGLLRRPW